MANLTANRAKHATLTAATVDVVTFAKAFKSVEVVNRSATDPIYATVDRGQANDIVVTPTVAGDDTFYVGPGGVRVIADDEFQAPVSAVRLISAGAAPYSVTGMVG